MTSHRSFSFVVACNDDEVLKATLLRSPDVQGRELAVQEGFSSASGAYNEGIRKTTGEIIIFLHQDVFLPDGWLGRLCDQIDRIEKRDPDWGVIGLVGVREDGSRVGHIYSVGLRRRLGGSFNDPSEIVALDEVVLIVRRAANLQFDEGLFGFHHYGTDICLIAKERGMRSYAVDDFCVHNSNGLRRLPRAFWQSYSYMRRKWRKQLPIQTNIVPISKSPVPIIATYLETLWVKLSGRTTARKRVDDAEKFYRQELAGLFKVAALLLTAGFFV